MGSPIPEKKFLNTQQKADGQKYLQIMRNGLHKEYLGKKAKSFALYTKVLRSKCKKMWIPSL